MDILVHSQDIALPLGRDLPMPVDTGAAVARHVHGRGFPFPAARRFDGLRFVTSDVDLVLGDGQRVHGPVAAIVLILTGRAASRHTLAGPGLTHPALVG